MSKNIGLNGMAIRDRLICKETKRLIISLHYVFLLCRAYKLFRHNHITFVWNSFHVSPNYQRFNAFYFVSIKITATVYIKFENEIVDEAEFFRYKFEDYFVDVELQDLAENSRCKLKLLFRRRSWVLSF